MSTRVLVVHNEPVLPDGHPESMAERGITDTVDAVRGHLASAGFEVECLAIRHDLQASLAEISLWQPDVIFNLFEGWGNDPASEALVAGALESTAIPLSGCSAHALRVAGSKHLAKAVLTTAGLPTPRSEVISGIPFPPCRLAWPVIAKPALYHGSIGIEQASVAIESAALERRVAYLLARYDGPVLVEEFISGREFTVAVVETPEPVVLPIMEFEFVDPTFVQWPLVTYGAKWRPGTHEYEATPMLHNVRISAGLARLLTRLAGRAFQHLGCRDCARIDFRVDAGGAPWILEVNPNPDLSPTACLAGALAAAGLDYGGFIATVARNAQSRAAAARLTHAGARR